MKQTKQENISLFSPAPFFMIRTPLLPSEEFFQLVNQNYDGTKFLSDYLNHEVLREAIAIASPTLHDALQHIDEKNDKERQQILSSLLKYKVRMSTRSTPFGLFACVSQGKWGETTSIHFEHQQIVKRARPDMEWLIKVIDLLCEHPESFDNLLVQVNPLLLRQGNRIVLNGIRSKEDDKKHKKVSINASPVTTLILDSNKQALTVEQLIDKILKEAPFLDREKIRGMIRKLLEQQFLLFTLRPSLLTSSCFHDLLEKIDSLQANSAFLPSILKLNEIASKIVSYNQQGIGKGEQALQDIASLMSEFAPSQHFLQVDSAYQSETVTLNRTISDELKETTEVLWQLSFRNDQNLQNYHAKFIEKYGFFRKVPLLELLSEEGLGIPEFYTHSIQERNVPLSKEVEWNKWLKSEWCNCLHERSKEIILNKQIIHKLLGPVSDKEKAPLSFDLYCEVIAESAAHIDQGEFLLNVFYNTWQAGSTFGRFIDILGLKTRESLQQLYQQEESLEKNCLFAESSYLPLPYRYANVATYANLRHHVIDSEVNALQNNISMEEILVGVFQDRFYLSLKGRSEELIVVKGNVLNPTHAPIPLRFIRDISRTRYASFDSFSLSELETAPFAPRIRYNRSILSPAQWRTTLDQIGATPKNTLQQIGDKFLAWATKWELPQYVFVTLGDNRLLLQYRKPEHLHEISSILKKEKAIKLVEKIGQEKGEWVKSSQGHHFSEFVIPFIKNPAAHTPLKCPPLAKSQEALSPYRWKLPGSEWLFVKFYVSKENEVNFILHNLSAFAKNLQNQGIIQSWFFIRYFDHSPHIRVRFRSEKEKILNLLIPALHDWLLFLLQNHLIHDMNIGCYERETERYGGEELIEFAENFFCADTSTAIDLMHSIVEEKPPLPDYAITALSIIDILKGLEMTIEEMLLFLQSSFSDQSELKGFRQIKNHLLSLVLKILEDGSHSDGLQQAFKKRKDALRIYKQKIIECDQQDKLSHSFFLIQNSLIHMHCNRLLGNQVNLEKKACLYAYHTLRSLMNKQ